jgi:hypothetical protein
MSATDIANVERTTPAPQLKTRLVEVGIEARREVYVSR